MAVLFEIIFSKKDGKLRVSKSLVFLIVFLMSSILIGCSAPQKQCSASFYNHTTLKKSVVKRIRISECPRRVKTVVYNDICSKCNYPVSVRENNCCYKGGCK